MLSGIGGLGGKDDRGKSNSGNRSNMACVRANGTSVNHYIRDNILPSRNCVFLMSDTRYHVL
jgi:hypothetical protein